MASQEHTPTFSFEVGLESIRDLFNETSEVDQDSSGAPDPLWSATLDAVAAAHDAAILLDHESGSVPPLLPPIHFPSPAMFYEYLSYRIHTYGYNSFTFSGFPNDAPGACSILPREAYSSIDEYVEDGKYSIECIDFAHLESLLRGSGRAVQMGLCDKLFFDYLDRYHYGLMEFMAKADDEIPHIQPLRGKVISGYSEVRVRVERAVLESVVAEKIAALEFAVEREETRMKNVCEAIEAGQTLYWPSLGPSMEEAKRMIEWRGWELMIEQFRLEKIEEVPLCEHFGIRGELHIMEGRV